MKKGVKGIPGEEEKREEKGKKEERKGTVIKSRMTWIVT